MLNKSQYEKRIMKEIQSMPEEALPKVVRLLALIREEFMESEDSIGLAGDSVSHEKTRALLASSKGNWAQEIIAEREDRV